MQVTVPQDGNVDSHAAQLWKTSFAVDILAFLSSKKMSFLEGSVTEGPAAGWHRWGSYVMFDFRLLTYLALLQAFLALEQNLSFFCNSKRLRSEIGPNCALPGRASLSYPWAILSFLCSMCVQDGKLRGRWLEP